jgi:hypothetical protein
MGKGRVRGAQLEGAQLAAEAVSVDALPRQQAAPRVGFGSGVQARRARLQLPRQLSHLPRVARDGRVCRRVKLRAAQPRQRRQRERSLERFLTLRRESESDATAQRRRPRHVAKHAWESAPQPRCPPTGAEAPSGQARARPTSLRTRCDKRVRQAGGRAAARSGRGGAPGVRRSAWSAASREVRPARKQAPCWPPGPTDRNGCVTGSPRAALLFSKLADADVRVEWLEPPGAGSGTFKPLSARGVRVSVALAEASGLPVLVLGLKPKEARARLRRSTPAHRADAARRTQVELPLLRLRCFSGMIAQGRLTLRLEAEARPRGMRGAQVMLSSGAPDALAALARAAEAAARGGSAPAGAPALSRPPLAQLNGAKRPLGISPGKPAQPSRRGDGEGGAAPAASAPLSAEQQRAVDLVASRRNVFITGAAGTGKSHVLRAALERAPCGRGATFLTAPTGLAAAELGPGGMTLNAFAGVGRAEGTVDQLIAVRASALRFEPETCADMMRLLHRNYSA